MVFCRQHASLPRPKLSQVTESEEWIATATSSIKSDEKSKTNAMNLTSTASQPFCDPPIKRDDIDTKNTFKETEQEVAILPSDLNKNAHVSLRQLCDYYTRLSKKNLTSMFRISMGFFLKGNSLL